uniref:BTB domain-containing protein n=1 Tax=Aegilops tauschii subsp. strangulata TaxID=200361 RepID=A0A453GG84_AEGTS
PMAAAQQPHPLPPVPAEGAAPLAAPAGAPRPYELAVAAAELRPVDCNLAALCDHVQAEGFGSGAFSDVVVEAMGATYRLHRLIISRSTYFRNMLHGPWREAGAPTVVLHIDDSNIDSEAIAIALAYLYGQPPKLNDNNAFRVLAAASFLDLQGLCTICTDFIISELWTSNFLQYQLFAESQDYGSHGERVRNACWGYLCQSATLELREVLPKLSSQTLHALLTSDELWVPNEEKRFELALFALLAKVTVSDVEVSGNENLDLMASSLTVDCSIGKGKGLMNETGEKQLMESELQNLKLHDNMASKAANNIIDVPNVNAEASKRMENDISTGGPSAESTSYQFNENMWLSSEQTKNYFSRTSSSNGLVPCEWGRPTAPLWGGRVVGRRQVRCSRGSSSLSADEYNTFMNIFERGSLLYCNMSFDALLSVRKQLEEFEFPCKAVNDGLWLQMLLCHRVQAIVADTCRNCCLTSNSCACKQAYVSTHSHYRQEHDRTSASGTAGSIYLADGQGDGNGMFSPVRVNVRGAVDGLAGIGRGNSNVPGAAWAPTRYVFSRVPYGLGSRNGQQSFANDESEPRVDHNGDIPGDGLTALVNLSQESNASHHQAESIFEAGMQTRYSGAATVSTPGGSSLQMQESKEHEHGSSWESADNTAISLDMRTPLSHFPPFRFGVEFEDVHRLSDGQVKHSAEVFYAGSLWKVSVQAFNDEDPHGRRTLGLFLHRRKAELLDPLRKAHMYIDPREKVTARYQLICPSKREVMIFGSLKQAGTLLPKAPKGWGWRTAILFDELADLLQGGALRIAAVVQLV